MDGLITLESAWVFEVAVVSVPFLVSTDCFCWVFFLRCAATAPSRSSASSSRGAAAAPLRSSIMCGPRTILFEDLLRMSVPMLWLLYLAVTLSAPC